MGVEYPEKERFTRSEWWDLVDNWVRWHRNGWFMSQSVWADELEVLKAYGYVVQ